MLLVCNLSVINIQHLFFYRDNVHVVIYGNYIDDSMVKHTVERPFDVGSHIFINTRHPALTVGAPFVYVRRKLNITQNAINLNLGARCGERGTRKKRSRFAEI